MRPESQAFIPFFSEEILLLHRLWNGHGEQRVEDCHNRRKGEEITDPEPDPDPSAYRGRKNGDQVVDGDPRGKGGGQFILIFRQTADIDIGGKRGRAEDCIQYIVDRHDPECDPGGEKIAGKSVKQTHKEQHHGIPDHGVAVSPLIREFPDERRSKDIDECAEPQNKIIDGEIYKP